MTQVGTTPETTNPPVEEEEELQWHPPMPPTDLIFDDGEPLESNRHRLAMNVLINSLEEYWQERDDFFAGGNMFIYYSSEQAKNRDFKGPDVFVVLNTTRNQARQGWVVWEEKGRYPDVIIELTSPSTRKIDLTSKKDIYEQTFKTKYYIVYDPFNPSSLQVWQLDIQGRYVPVIPDQRGWLWCDSIQLWLGLWQGDIFKESAHWLRLYDPLGNLLLLGEEKARIERQRADREAQRADTEAQRAEAEAQTAQLERQRAERLAARLRELGIEEGD